MTTVSFILPAAGAGRRFGGDVPKPFQLLQGRPILFHTLERLQVVPGLREVVVVLPPQRFTALEAEWSDRLCARGVTRLVPGADSRQASVARGLAALEAPVDLVAVHDGVRPFPTPALHQALCATAQAHGGALPALPVTDTIKRVVQGRIAGTVPRADLVTVQTPQVFQAQLLRRAYAGAADLGPAVTDDAALVEAAGGTVVAVPGERWNLKITTPADLALAEQVLGCGWADPGKTEACR